MYKKPNQTDKNTHIFNNNINGLKFNILSNGYNVYTQQFIQTFACKCASN